MKKIIITSILVLFSISLYSEKLGIIPEIMKPGSITVDKEELFIVEGSTIFIYSLIDLKFKKKFGKKGDGPGELPQNIQYLNKINTYKDHILVECINKLIYFTRDGKLIKEVKKKSPFIIQSIPIKKNFAVNKIRIDRKEKKIFNCIAVYDSGFNELKEIYTMEHMQQGQGRDTVIDMLLEYPMFRVYDNKIFIEKGDRGFMIDVYDQSGNKLYQIKRDYIKEKITQKYKETIFNKFKHDPVIKVQGGWENFKKIVNMTFPKTYPAIQGIDLSDNKIYIQTYIHSGNKEKYIITDLKGKLLREVMLPKFKNVTLIGSILGTKLHTIKNRYLYYLIENEDKEEWELYKENI